MNENHLKESDLDLIQEMMKTIHIPKNINSLSETLPPPNYDPLK